MANLTNLHPASAQRASRRFSVVLVLVAAMAIPVNSIFDTAAFAAKSGQSCTKTGMKTGSFICTLVKGKRIWRPVSRPAPVPVPSPPSNLRVTSDQPDTVTGFQVKPFYVVPSDGVDHSYDTNGYISSMLDEGNLFLNAQLGLTVPIDKHGTGYDIQYLKSKYSTAYIQSAFPETDEGITDKLLAEINPFLNPGLNRKDFIFFIDVNGLNAGLACGTGQTPGIAAVVSIGKGFDATGQTCTGKSHGLNNFATHTWVHELFHNFGVNHTLNDPCDLMVGAESVGTCAPSAKITIDKEHSRYVKSSVQGADVLQARVWTGQTDNLALAANCSLNPVPRADGANYAYCPTGTQTIGALKNCWGALTSVTLEEFVDGAWKSLGVGSNSPAPWGLNAGFACTTGVAPKKQLTITAPGTSLYRWMIPGQELEEFKVIWVN
jgi:hypothetical protein